MEDKISIALENFRNGFNCAQAVLTAFNDSLGLDTKTSLKLTSGFGGGIAGFQEVCGALTAAAMIVGLKYGMYEIGDNSSKVKTQQLINTIYNRFIEIHKSLLCKNILDCDFKTEEGQNKIKKENLFMTKCTKCIENTINIIDEVL